MGFMDDDLGNKSMMRKIVWVLILSIIVWMAAELTAYIWLTALEKEYSVHTSFILAALGIVLGGKATQKGIELLQKPKKEEALDTEG